MSSTPEQAFPIGCLDPFQALLSELSELFPGQSITLQPQDLAAQLYSFGRYPLGVWVSEYGTLVLDRVQQHGEEKIHAVVNAPTLAARLQDWQSHCHGDFSQQLSQAREICVRYQDAATVTLNQKLLEHLLLSLIHI